MLQSFCLAKFLSLITSPRLSSNSICSSIFKGGFVNCIGAKKGKLARVRCSTGSVASIIDTNLANLVPYNQEKAQKMSLLPLILPFFAFISENSNKDEDFQDFFYQQFC